MLSSASYIYMYLYFIVNVVISVKKKFISKVKIFKKGEVIKKEEKQMHLIQYGLYI